MPIGNFKRYSEWLRKRGPTLVGHELGVGTRTVWFWIYGEAQPRPETAKKIIELSKGEITFDDIYCEESKGRNSCRKP